MNRLLVAGLLGCLAIAGAGLPQPAQAAAAQEIDAGVAAGLDKAEAAFSRHNRAHREWEIRRSIESQHRAGRHHGHAYGRGRGYGPPPGHGWRRHDYDRGYAYRRIRPYGY